MTAVHSPAPGRAPAGTVPRGSQSGRPARSAVSGLVERGWEFRGYHSWDAYCGQAAAPGLAGPAPAVVPTRSDGEACGRIRGQRPATATAAGDPGRLPAGPAPGA